MSSDPSLPPTSSLGGLDGLFANRNILILILFSFCCSGLALILGIVGLIACKDPRAKQNALVMTIVGALTGGVAVLLQMTGLFNQ